MKEPPPVKETPPVKEPPTTPGEDPPLANADGTHEVRIISVPAGAVVRINGVVAGETPLTIAVPVGTPLKIAVEKEGHAPFQTVWKGGASTVRAKLAPLAGAAEKKDTP